MAKIRNDFVTNSSSSSFILAFDSKEMGQYEIEDLTHKYGSNYIQILLEDFNSAEPIPIDSLKDYLKDEIDDVIYDRLCWRTSNRKTYRERWYESHPEARRGDFENSPEFKTEAEKISNEFMSKFMTILGDRSYIVELEYGDHSPVGSQLEHEILPNADFVVEWFSHH